MKRRSFLLLVVGLLWLGSAGVGQEIVTLTTPLAKPSQTTTRLERITIDVLQKNIYIQWQGNNGEPGSAAYPTPAPLGSSQPSGATLLTTLNKMNFSGGNLSFVARVIARLQADGHIPAGSLGGTPE